MVTEKYEQLKVMRRGHQGVVTKLSREADTLLAGDSPTSEQIACLRIIHEQLENKMQLLQSMDSEILTLCNLEDIEGKIEESEPIVAKILEYKCLILAALRSPRVSNIVSTVPETTTRLDTVATAEAEPTQNGNARLPKLILPKFKGNVPN